MWATAIVTASLAVAAPERVVVLPLDGDASTAVQETLSDALDAGLERGGFEPVRADAQPPSCVAPDCEIGLMRDTGTAFSIRADVRKSDNVYRLRIEARDGSGKLLGTAEDLCEICGVQEVGDMLTDRVAALSERLQVVAPASLQVSSTPSGVSVWIDDTLAGVAPVEVELSPGEHEVRLEREGFVEQRRTVHTVDGVRESLHVELAAAPLAPRPHRPWTIGGAVAAGSGVAALAAGVSLLVVHDRPFQRDCNPDREGNCSHLYDTVGVGAGLTVVGTAALVTAVVLLVVGRDRRRASDQSLVSAAGRGWEMRF